MLEKINETKVIKFVIIAIKYYTYIVVEVLNHLFLNLHPYNYFTYYCKVVYEPVDFRNLKYTQYRSRDRN